MMLESLREAKDAMSHLSYCKGQWSNWALIMGSGSQDGSVLFLSLSLLVPIAMSVMLLGYSSLNQNVSSFTFLWSIKSNFSIFLFSLKAKPCAVALLILELQPHLICPRLISIFLIVGEFLTLSGNVQLVLCKSKCKTGQWVSWSSLLPRPRSILVSCHPHSSHILHKMMFMVIQQ